MTAHTFLDPNCPRCASLRAASADTLPKGRDAKQGSVRSKGSATAKPGRPMNVIAQLARDSAE